MTDGHSDRWIKFHIKALDNPIFTEMTPAVAKVFMICLLEANWQDRKWWDGRSEVTIKRGSFPTSILALSKKYNLTRQELRSAFCNLQKVGSVTSRATTHYTLVTVEKYDTYQGGDDEDNQPNNQPNLNGTTNQQPTNNQPTTTLLECLEYLEENTISPSPLFSAGSNENGTHDFELAPPTNGTAKRSRVTREGPALQTVKSWLAEFQAAYPRKDGRWPSVEVFRKHVVSEEVFNAAMVAISEGRGGTLNPDTTFVPFPCRWIKEEMWKLAIPALPKPKHPTKNESSIDNQIAILKRREKEREDAKLADRSNLAPVEPIRPIH